MNKKGFLDISFSWIFAFIVGGLIIFGAVYGMSKFRNVEESKLAATSASDIGAFLNPLETSGNVIQSVYLKMPLESRIYNKCDLSQTFGSQQISVKEKIKNQWTGGNVDISYPDKYIFSSYYEEGREFFVFSKPFSFPFKVANLMYLTSANEEYCFVDPPKNIEEELTKLNQNNILVDNCTENSIKVCFDGGCDIRVDYKTNRVVKDEDLMYFVDDATMYAAIFSDMDTYECQISRLILRTKVLAQIYSLKASSIEQVGCYGVTEALPTFIAALENYDGSWKDISALSQDLGNRNERTSCRLW